MYFEPSAHDFDFPAYFHRLLKIAPQDLWTRRFGDFAQWRSKNPFIESFLRRRFPIEIAMFELMETIKTTGQIPTKFEAPHEISLASFVAMVAGVHLRVNESGKRRIEGTVRDGLKDEKGLSPFAFEMRTAAHLLRSGFSILCNDIELGGGVDFVASGDDVEIEIECKHVSGDIGRQIHLRRLYDLGERVVQRISPQDAGPSGGLLVTVTLPGKLIPGRINAIAQEVTDTVRSKEKVRVTDDCTIESTAFAFDGTPMATALHGIANDTLSNFLESQFGIVNSNCLMTFHPKRGAIIVHVRSRKADAVLSGIVEQLKTAGRDQLTGRCPGVLCVHLADLSSSELASLANSEAKTFGEKGTGIQWAATYLLRKRPRVHTLAFMTFGRTVSFPNLAASAGGISMWEGGPAYVIQNPDHPMSGDRRFEIF